MKAQNPHESYSKIADKYDLSDNDTSFWGQLARTAYERIVIAPRHRTVMEIGCGTGNALGHLGGRLPAWSRLVGVEPAEQMRRAAAKRVAGMSRVEVVEGRFERVPVPDHSVDYLYSIWAFHWVADPLEAAAELQRILADGAELDLWFVGWKTGCEFASKAAHVLEKYVDLEARLSAASTSALFDRARVQDVFGFLGPVGLTITEETVTHYDTLERHWSWQIRSESHYSVLQGIDRERFDSELREALATLAQPRGIPYTRHSFHVRYRHVPRTFLAVPEWLEQGWPAAELATSEPAEDSPVLCTLTADTDEDLKAGAARLGEAGAGEWHSPLTQVSATVGENGGGRYRASVVGAGRAQAAARLADISAGRVPPFASRGVSVKHPVIAFVFSGQNAERTGIARALYEKSPAFRAGVDECARHAREWTDASLVDLLCRREDEAIGDDVHAHVVLFALQYALAHLWRSLGVHPSVVVGHSRGEYAAACVAGALTLSDAMALVVGRGRAMRDHARPGAMCAVRASAERVAPYLERHPGAVLSAINGPQSVVVAGETASVEAIRREATADGLQTKRLATGHAFHSPNMDPAVAPLRAHQAGRGASAPVIPFVSTVDGGREIDVPDGEYWVRHMLAPVQFSRAVEALESRCVSAYLEIGPGGVLSQLVAENLAGRPGLSLSSLGGDDDPWRAFLCCAGALHAHGVDLDATWLTPSRARRVVHFAAADDAGPGGADSSAAGRAGRSAAPWERELSRVRPSDRLRASRRLVRDEIADLQGPVVCDEAFDRGFIELGLTSSQLVTLARRVSEGTGRQISDTVAFSHPSVGALARFVLSSLELESTPEPGPADDAGPGAIDAGEPIAIVGAACRLPGAASDPAQLWSLLERGKITAEPFPADRRGLVSDASEASSSAEVTRASFLESIAAFDASFFGISPREAAYMDPAQRLLLEVSWEALESAGLVPASLSGSSAGVFVGIGPSEYGAPAHDGPTGTVEAYAGLGTAPSIAAGRISYFLGLQGPCMAIDTACSSSLVSVHAACQSLRAGECGLALAGGVSLMLASSTFAWLSSSRALSPDGLCKTFSADADGYGRGEGCGIIVLKRLGDALRDGDRILALVRGSASNHDGASSGLTAPNGASQQKVLRGALQNAGCAPQSVAYVEAHGTGTPLGDPIEIEALAAVYGPGRPAEAPLLLGSLKTNIGHLEYAAGIAGLLKVVLSLRAGRIPAHLQAQTLNPHVAWGDLPLAVPASNVPWPEWNSPRRAGVSSFGLSGTNAHVILEEAPAKSLEEPARTTGSWPSWPVLLSGKSEHALRAQADRLRKHVEAHPEQSLADVACSLATSRTHFEHRAAVIAGDRQELLASLRAVAGGQSAPLAATGRSAADGKVVFVFPGQGSQWLGMATALLETSPAFRAQLEACEQALAPHVSWSLLAVLRGEQGPGGLDRVDVVQPALFAVMVSLAALWRSLGVVPHAVIGHSQGEIAAAYVAGALSLGDAARIVALRSRALASVTGRGTMAALELGVRDVQERIARWGERLAVAAINGPRSTLVSGDHEAIDALLSELSAAQIFARKVRVDYPSHCVQMEAVRDELLAQLGDIAPRAGRLVLYSTVTGERVDGEQLDAGYWYRNLRETVRFADAVEKLAADGHRFFVEVSPHTVLTLALKEALEGTAPPPVVVGSLCRDEGRLERVLLSMGELHVGGLGLDWSSWFESRGARRVDVPTYAFQRERHWLEARTGKRADVSSAGLSPAEHPLLGAAVVLADGHGTLLTGRLSLNEHAWLGGHCVFGTTIVPGTALLEMALTAGYRVGAEHVEELTLLSPLALPSRGALMLQMAVGSPDESGRRALTVHSRPQEAAAEVPWTCHATGTLRPATASDRVADDLGAWPPPGAEALPIEGLYERLAAAGLSYAGEFRGLRAAWKRGEELFAEAQLPPGTVCDAGAFALHPALLDSALHALMVTGKLQGVALPFAWTGVSVRGVGASVVRVRLRPLGSQRSFALDVADAAGQPIAFIEALALRATTARQIQASTLSGSDSLHQVHWMPVGVPSAAPRSRSVVVLGAPLSLAGADGAPVRAAHHADLAALQAALGQGGQAPEVAIVAWPAPEGSDPAAAAHAETARALSLLQHWVADERLASTRLVLLTRRAVATRPDEDVLDLAHAPLWGLVRAARQELSLPLVVVDSDGTPASERLLLRAVGAEDELALRDGEALAPRLIQSRATQALAAPDAASWCLRAPSEGTFDELTLVEHPAAGAPLEPGQVRIAVRAAGLNFRDVVLTIGMVRLAGPLGTEGAGEVVEVGPGVAGFAVGDRVMGLFAPAFGPLAVADVRLVTHMPRGWTFAQGASVPGVFLTAYYGLVDLGRLEAGQRVLVHAAAGGVGTAAVQLARHLGAEVFATASPAKWGALRAQGIDDGHLASSRDLAFEQHFLRSTAGGGVDLVLDCLAREFVDASLRLLPRGGRFVEMGKTDIRDASAVAASHPGVAYRAFDLEEAGAERIAQMLALLRGLFEEGALTPPPITAWDVRHAPLAFRALAQARHVGKFVLTLPRRLDPDGTVLVTGGTGTLGGLVARHMVAQHGARHLLLTSRQGLEAPGADVLRRELEASGASVTVARCDSSDRESLDRLLGSIPSEHPLTAVVHAAGVLDDGVLVGQTPDRLDRVMAPKVDAAWHLHELTADRDLAAFVLFSSVAGVVGSAGQTTYAAANGFLDALAQHRRARGMTATSLAWGFWAQASGMTAHLSMADAARLEQAGVRPLSSAQGLALFDAALQRPEAALVPARLDLTGLASRPDALAPIYRSLVRPRTTRPVAASAALAVPLARQLQSLSDADRARTLLELVRTHAASVLRVTSSDAFEAERPFRELGLDSLMALELRNRLAASTGLRLPATLLFDHPTPAALAQVLGARLLGAAPPQPAAEARPPVAPAEDPIAIVAMSCRFPGQVSSPEELWQLVLEGRDAISAPPDDRGWDFDALDRPGAAAEGRLHHYDGGFLRDADRFDPAFFGISPREAVAVDPQQRLLLETSWEVFERAGIRPAALQGTSCGVFVGLFGNEYLSRLPAPAPRDIKDFVATGSMTSVASGRIAYTLGLHGPAISVDTACSSSLVAVHLACQALRRQECDVALAGGVTVLATPRVFDSFDSHSAGAPDGRCKAFSAEANGAGWAEGAGMLLLERLSDAVHRGHPVLAILRGSAINQDGKSQGLTAPSGRAQELVIRQALESARLAESDVDAVEAHGTGTALGDPIEAQALLATYGAARSAERPLWLGSLKSNIGHTQAAAGVGGIVKMVMALQSGLLPRTLHAGNPSPHIDWSTGTVKLLTEEVTWKAGDHPRRAGVSSFGISGTNAHVILEEAPAPVEADAPCAATQGAQGPWPLLLSGKSEGALHAQAGRLLAQLEHAEPSLQDLAYSLATGRTHFDHRASVVVRDREQLHASLDALARGQVPPDATAGRVAREQKLAVLFTGQGSQRVQMGRALYEALSAYRAAFDAVCAELDAHLDRPLREVVFAEAGSPEAALLDQTGFAQPALFALEVALFRVLEGLGARAELLLGHSIGEVVAAHAAGVLSLADACKLVGARARLMQALPASGVMVAVQASEAELATHLAGRGDRASIAAVNGPTSTVVAGDPEAVQAAAAHFEALGRKTTRLRVSHAFHSAHMDGMLEAFGRVAASLTYRPARIPVVSNLTGRLATDAELGSPEYWVRQVRETVRFADGVHTVLAHGARTLLELGPHPVLAPLAALTATEDVRVVTTLRSGRGDADALTRALGELHVGGTTLDWAAWFEGSGAKRVALPTYAFQRERYWLEAPQAGRADVASAGLSPAEHPLLGAAVMLAEGDAALFTGRLSLAEHGWLAGHAVFGATILPGTALLEMALAAGQRVGAGRVEELTLQAPLGVPSRGAVLLQMTVGAADASGRRALAVHGRPQDAATGAPWTRHATGTLGPAMTGDRAPGDRAASDLSAWPPPGAEALSTDGLYERLAAAGLGYGGEFQGLRSAYRRGQELFAEAHLPHGAAVDAAAFALHPALLDSALHALMVPGDLRGVALPFAWTGVSVRATDAGVVRVHIRPVDGERAFALDVADGTGKPIASIERLDVRPASADRVWSALATRDDALLRLEWQEAAPLPASKPASCVLLDRDPLNLGTTTTRYPDLAALQRAFDDGVPAPEVVVVPCRPSAARDLVAAAHAATARAVSLLQQWASDERLASTRLVLLTERAVAVRSGEGVEDLVHAPLWGLVRSAQRELPLVPLFLVDSDLASHRSVLAALDDDDRQIALRGRQRLVPRLARAGAVSSATPATPAPSEATQRLDPAGTVLVTGGTGTLGGRVARHLVTRHGVRHLVLTSRQGADAPGADDLRRELEGSGASVTVARCDTSDRASLEALLGSVPREHPLTAVIHAAGVLDDGLLARQTPERLDRVMAPKVDAAWHLHELTASLDLAAFVLFSSVAGVLGSAGQTTYAAANGFLDALAQHRRARGLTATSLAWGTWAQGAGMTAHLSAADTARIEQAGVRSLAIAEALALFDAALQRPEAALVAARLDLAGLAARAESLPSIYRALVRPLTPRPLATTTPAVPLAQQLQSLSDADRARALLDLVRTLAAGVIALPSPTALDPGQSLQDLGFDSLLALELRNRLQVASGLRLPATFLFDYPTVEALARMLDGRLPKAASKPHPVVAEIEPLARVGE